MTLNIFSFISIGAIWHFLVEEILKVPLYQECQFHVNNLNIKTFFIIITVLTAESETINSFRPKSKFPIVLLPDP